jgi:hypothetical protein
VTTASVGPNAISVGSTAISSSGGVGGSNGLNAGPSYAQNIALTIPNTNNIFDIPNIDVRIDFRRYEFQGTIISRGAFSFNANDDASNFKVTYRVTNGSSVTVISSSAVPIPFDGLFRTYRFTYDNCLGKGSMFVNANLVWTSGNITPGQNLFWQSDGNLIIGSGLDGANINIPIFDNFILQPFLCSTLLPITLKTFTASKAQSRNIIEWTTASEMNNDHFILERSEDCLTWNQISKVKGLGNSSADFTYKVTDEYPLKTFNYYRLLQTDLDGEIKTVGLICVNNTPPKKPDIIRAVDLFGNIVPNNFTGPKIIFYSELSIQKVYEK